jgi:glycosyltransferase involved in cell wall biosynthesis
MSASIQRLALVTDAWHPQTNGVVNTLTRLVRYLESQGTDVLVVTSDGHRTVPMPLYDEIRLAWDPWKAIRRICDFKPEAVHIATEGPLGLCARLFLARERKNFTSSFHTRFPEYLRARLPVPLAVGYGAERWFHGRAVNTMVGTLSLIRELQRRHIGARLVHWPRGVDDELFHPEKRRDGLYELPRPVWLYVGRVAVEKSLESFLGLDLPGTKVVVGDGPAREGLERRFPATVWRGWRRGEDLASHFASADCFVFPSRTETFGNVILEALASGLPVASVPAPGPVDLIWDGRNGALDDDLYSACVRALQCSKWAARKTALRYTWRASHEVFRSHLVPV